MPSLINNGRVAMFIMKALIAIIVPVFLLSGCGKPHQEPKVKGPNSEGPIVVGKGAGQSEFALIFAHQHMAELLRQCLLTCELGTDEKRFAVDLEKRLVTDPLPQPVFKGKNDLGDVRFRRANREVWINQDLLWLDDAKTRALDVAAATSLWLDVVTEGLKQADERDLVERLKTKLVKELSAETKYAGHKFHGEHLLNAFLWRQHAAIDSSDRLFLGDFQAQVIELTSKAAGATRGSGIKFFAMNWITPVGAEQKELAPLHLEVSASWLTFELVPVRGTLDFIIPIRKVNERYIIGSEEISVIATEE
jgi:hypothetical protein